ncbi:MAG TPA: hypothetical protein VLF67_02560 [Candidatus Saccharimonas sp.]|nr:hypothetical protein [Candidatus Saccharimonas sp.]
MFRIPGTKPTMGPAGLALTGLFIYALAVQDWDLVKLYGIVVGCYVLIATLTMLLTSHTRRPGESAWACLHRSVRELDNKEERGTDHYVTASCGHTVQVYSPQTPAIDDVVWCPAHRWFGPAERTTVTNPYDWPQRGRKTIIGAELD